MTRLALSLSVPTKQKSTFYPRCAFRVCFLNWAFASASSWRYSLNLFAVVVIGLLVASAHALAEIVPVSAACLVSVSSHFWLRSASLLASSPTFRRALAWSWLVYCSRQSSIWNSSNRASLRSSLRSSWIECICTVCLFVMA